jgi:hypothetical protein
MSVGRVAEPFFNLDFVIIVKFGFNKIIIITRYRKPGSLELNLLLIRNEPTKPEPDAGVSSILYTPRV